MKILQLYVIHLYKCIAAPKECSLEEKWANMVSPRTKTS